MGRVGLIRQPGGIGDIAFTQKIVKKLIENGEMESVIWPVYNEYSYLSKYMPDENISYVDEDGEFPFKNIYLNDGNIYKDDRVYYLPLQRADRIMGGNSMLSKYQMMGMDLSDWVNYFNFVRDLDREKVLMDYFKDFDFNSSFTLVNRNFGSKTKSQSNYSLNIPKPEGRVLNMDFCGFENLFDWIGIVEKATAIHITDTGFCYIINKLGKKDVTVYSRWPNNMSFFCYAYEVFDKDWTLVL